MKHFFRFATLLLLAALTSIEASAQDRIRPIPVTQKTFEVNTPYYLYNVGRGMFANKGEAWGTQSTLGHQGMKYEVRHDDDMPEGYYYLYSDETGKNNKVMFRTNGDGNAGSGVCAAFVDNNKGDNAYWTIQPFNDNVTGGFIIQIPEDTKGSYPFVATQAWGAQWDHWGKFFDSNGITYGIFFDIEIAANPDNVTWQFVSEDDYATYQDGLDTEAVDAWNAANDLKDWIDLAKQRGADVAAAEELYNNTASSSADLRAALADLKPYVDAQKAAVKLQAAIDQAGEYGVDVAEAQEVLNNPEATAAEINEATDKLNGEIKVAKTAKVLSAATSSEPVDLFAEAIFENATFTDNISGWTSTTTVQNKAHKSPNASEIVSCGVDGKNAEGKFYENWDPSASKAVGKMYQKQAELPAGLYVGKLSVFVSNLSQNNTGDAPEQFAYLNDVKAPLTSGPFKSYTMFLQQAEKADIEMGFEQTAAVANWLGIDNASLKYYGDGSDNYKGLAADLIGADWEAEFVDEEGQWPIHTAVEREAVSNAIFEGANAGTPEAGIAAADKAIAALDGLRTNIKLWKQLDQTVYGNGNDVIGMYDQQYNLEINGWENESAFRALLDELAEKLDEIMDDPSKATWDNAELQKKLDRLNKLYDEALDYHAANALNVGDDLTDKAKFGEKFLKNPDFQNPDNFLYGWDANPKGNTGFFGGYPDVLECWNSNFNISQEVKLPKDGAYRLQTRAFYRTGPTSSAYPRWIAANGANEGENKSCAFLFAGNLTSPIANIYNTIYTREQVEAVAAFYDVERLQTGNNGSQFTCSDNTNPWEFPHDFTVIDADQDLYSPNGVFSASYIFNCYKGHEKTGALEDLAQKYTSYIDFIGEKNEVVRMGVKAENILDQGWTIFAPYHLYYKGNDPEVMKPVMAETINLAKELAKEAMSADSLTALTSAINAADGAETGAELMNAYKAINAAFGPAKSSANTYKTLADAKADLEQTLADRADKASDAAKSAASTEISLVNDMLKNGSIADADIPAEIEKIKAVKRELFRPIPGVYPADYTEFALQNPKFQEDWTGWEHSNYTSIQKWDVLVGGGIQNWGVAEGWNNAEFAFDINQTVTDLPEGVWEVRAQGLARLTDNPSNITRGFDTQDPEQIAALYELYADSIATLYANNDAVFLANPYLVPEGNNNQQMMKDNNGGAGGWFEMTDAASNPDNPETYFIPNDRQAFASRLGVDWYDAAGNTDPEGKWYENVVVTYVDESGVLKLGWKCDKSKANAWAPATNFRIIYYGPDDPRKENTGIREITSTKTVENTIFSADGRRMNGLSKGLNIIKSKTADGKTVVRKVVIK